MPDTRGHSVWVGVSGELQCLQMERVGGGTHLPECWLSLLGDTRRGINRTGLSLAVVQLSS